ncbi:MAG TPA: DUF1349 domain-containing protein [Bryobacteraceae bacterium]|nr:DUF1349 domain-containing protein [Bryobacteraceae bacterium]
MVGSAPDFSISAAPASQTVTVGASTTYTVTIGALNGFTGTVNLAASGLPTGATASFNPTSVSGSGTSTLTINTTGSTPPGSSTLTITGTSGSLTHTATVTLVVSASTPSGAISIKFVGSGTPMGTAETAGVVAKSQWNNATGASSAAALNLLDENGAATGASVTWSSDNTWNLPITDTAGNNRMMRGYLDNGSGVNPIAITVSGLSSGTYHVYVYADGDNAGVTRTGIYQISGAGITTTSISATDSANTNFTGAFVQASNSAGNYVVFSSVPISAGFTITATPGTSTGARRSPVNAIQIVPASGTSPDFTISASPASRTITAGTSTTYTATMGALNGFNGSINLAATGLPAGATASFSPASVNGSGTSTLTVTTTGSTPAGSSTITITGTSGSLVHSATVTLVVNPAGTSGPISDSFNNSSLNTTLWTFVNPVGDGSFQMTGTNLQLSVPAGPTHDLTSGGENAVRVMQSTANQDFDVQAKFDSTVSQQYQGQGILVEQDTANFIRFELLFSGSGSQMFSAAVLGSSMITEISRPITASAPIWLRVQRSGDTFSFSWSSDGVLFTTAGSFTQALTVTGVGVYGLNSGSPAPSFTTSVDYFLSGTGPDMTITKSHAGAFTQGGTGSYTLTANNAGTGTTNGTVTVTDTLPAGLTPTTATGAGWSCGLAGQTATCTRSDPLAGARSYPAITITVNVAANAPASLTNTASVAGGGELNTTNDSAADPTAINGVSAPDMTISKSHTGNFTQGGTGAYTLTASNAGNGPSAGTVTVTDTPPAELVPATASGSGWTCGIAGQTVTCTRSDPLNAGASYPAIALTVNVSASAPASVTNTATVSGGGETNSSNDSASDPTNINAASPGAPVSDDFTSTSLNTNVWTFVNPQNDGSFSLNGSSLLLSVPGGVSHDVWTTGDQAVRIMQSIADADFEVEAKFSSAVNIDASFQVEGIVVEQDVTNFLRFDVQSGVEQTRIFSASILGTTATVTTNQGSHGGATIWLRVKRTGSNWAFSYSYDSTHWTPAFTFTQALHVAKIGPFVGNAQNNGAAAPAFTAIVDHFVNRVSPPSVLDGNPYPPTPAPPVINVWYGDTQTFGQPGVPQQWVNILGDVSDFDQVTALSYTLNGGAPQTLWMGENAVRLVAPGNFNVEIDYASLANGSNTVAITAVDTQGRQSTHTVTVNYAAGNSWPLPYSINWSTAPSVQSVTQIVDGLWAIQTGGSVRNTQRGYDRILNLGDRTNWTNYTVTAEVTMNSLDPAGFSVGIVAGWQGHTTIQYGQPLPDQPRTGHPFPGAAGYNAGNGPPTLNIQENTVANPETVIAQDTSGRTLNLGVKYIFKFQAQANASGGSHYSFKVWPASASEPANWDLQADGELSNGSVILLAHECDITFGNVTIQ